MSQPNSPTPASEAAVLFRPLKKRKIYRQRATSEEPADPTTTTIPPAPEPQSLDELISSTAEDAEVDGVKVSMAEILRLRKQRKGKGGVEFKAGRGPSTVHTDGGQELVLRQERDAKKAKDGLDSNGGAVRKFAPQTGTVGDVDKHMMAYIDSGLAKHRLAETTQIPMGQNRVSAADHATLVSSKSGEVSREPAALGKIQEVDLGDEVRNRNVARTTRWLNGEPVVEDNVPTKPVKVRLGRDGKPWRGRKRRGSDDVARDKLVEDILRENRLEHYEEPAVPEPNSASDGAADDRIAEAFRKEFMDSASSRNRKKPGPPTAAKTVQGKKEEEALKGPKLGGSRNARAAMREQMLKDASKKR